MKRTSTRCMGNTEHSAVEFGPWDSVMFAKRGIYSSLPLRKLAVTGENISALRFIESVLLVKQLAKPALCPSPKQKRIQSKESA